MSEQTNDVIVVLRGFTQLEIFKSCSETTFPVFKDVLTHLKAALINLFLVKIERMTTYDVKVVAHTDGPTENCLFWFYSPQLYFFGSVSQLSSVLWPDATGSCFTAKKNQLR